MPGSPADVKLVSNAMANATRRKIMAMLVEGNRKREEIEKAVGATMLDYHLQMLQQAGLAELQGNFDGVYLALAGQDSRSLGVPNLSDILYAYPEIEVLAHEPSLFERNLLNQGLIELVELVDEERFLEKIRTADCMIIL